MKLLVCLKQILDPEIPPRDFRIDAAAKEAAKGSAKLVTNVFCENALETALQLRDKHGGEITTLTFGPASAEDVLRKSLALRADHACLVTNPGIPHCGSAAAARVLSAAINKLGSFDLILLGREAGDWGEGQTTGLVAEYLGLPCIAFVDEIEPAGAGNVKVRRQTETGWERFQVPTPAVLSITNSDHNVPRIPKTRDIMLAHKKPLTTWSLADVGASADEVQKEAAATEVLELFVPEKAGGCEFIAADTIEQRIDQFAQKLAAVLRSAG